MSLAPQQQIRVLHVDDEPDFADLTGTFLEREDDRFTVETVTSADDGLEIINNRPPDCVVSDYNMPGTDGLEFLQAVREDNPDLPFILYTGKGSEAVASEAISSEVTDYLQKGSGTGQYELLANRISNAVEQHQAKRRVELSHHAMDTANEGLSLVRPDGTFSYVNSAFAHLFEYDPDELIGEHWTV
jgi:DNA-binding NtrC family response regulator